MPVRIAVLAVFGTLALASPAAAEPTVATNRSCYYTTAKDKRRDLRDTIVVSGRGFPSGARLSFAADELSLRVLGGPRRTDATGAFEGTRVASPFLPSGERLFWLNVHADDAWAGRVITITDFAAGIAPSVTAGRRGLDLRRRVRITLYGWGRARTVYLHFVPPRSRRAKRTIRIARTEGMCGHATRRLRHFWPFLPRTSGTWRLQFDTRATYSPKASLAIPYLSVISLL